MELMPSALLMTFAIFAGWLFWLTGGALGMLAERFPDPHSAPRGRVLCGLVVSVLLAQAALGLAFTAGRLWP